MNFESNKDKLSHGCLKLFTWQPKLQHHNLTLTQTEKVLTCQARGELVGLKSTICYFGCFINPK